MAKVLVPFVIALAVAALAFNLSNTKPASDQAAGEFLEQSVTTPLRQSDETSDSGTEGGSPSEPSVTPNDIGTDSEFGEVEESVDETSANSRPPPAQPIYLPPEFDWLAEEPAKLRAHDMIQREPYNLDWAPAMEAHFSRFLGENPEFTQMYGYPTSIVCRTSMCELAFVAHGLETIMGDVEYQLSSHFNESVSDFFERSEFEEFHYPNRMIFLINRTENGVTSLLWQLVSKDRQNRPGGAFVPRDDGRKAADSPSAPTR